MGPLLQVRDLTKTFPGVRALDSVSMDVHAGEVVALVGQNGSGKSTLVKVLADVVQPDSGTIRLSGDNHVRAHREGAGQPQATLHFIHQDLGIVATLSTVENLGLGSSGPGLLPNRRKRERERASALLTRFGVQFDVTTPAQKLSPEERSIVAIARALDGWSTPNNVLVLDEPTAALQAAEVRRLFRAIRAIAESGAGVIFISHRLDEVLELADRIIVMRDGKIVTQALREETDHDDLVKMIAGRALDEVEPPCGSQDAAKVVLTARNVAGSVVAGVDLEIWAGEIVGISGLVGSGRDQLCGLLAGAQKRTRGEVVVREPLRKGDPGHAIGCGVAFIPADRHQAGGIMSMNARENLTLPLLAPLRRNLGWLDRLRERREVDSWFRAVAVRPHDPERRLSLFSGGNQQKVIIAKWLRTKPRVLLMDEPTQGVDVAAKVSVYELIRRAASDGAGVMVASSDVKELALLCDRVLVIRDGRITEELHRSADSEERILRATLGTSNSDPDLEADQNG